MGPLAKKTPLLQSDVLSCPARSQNDHEWAQA